MKLSEAMMLGSVTVKMEPLNMNSCAFGAALNAVGDERFGMARYTSLRERWPWLQDGDGCFTDAATSIYGKFDWDVCSKKSMTFEQLVDYVASIEPSCGDCNRFDCSCVKAETADAPVAELVAMEGRAR